MMQFKLTAKQTTVPLRKVILREIFTYPAGHQDHGSIFMKVWPVGMIDVGNVPAHNTLICNLTSGFIGFIPDSQQVQVLRNTDLELV
jgi:hypothetical protein